MAVLTLNANTASPITVVCQRAGKAAPRRVGTKSYSFNGIERNSIRGQAKIIPITTSYIDTATEALIQNAAWNGAQIPCSGDVLGNIQTLCSFESVISNMMPGLPGFFEMSFTLNEVNASVVLLKYAAGDTITGESFARATVAYQHNISGIPIQAAINVKRDAHYIGGVRSVLLEETDINPITFGSDFSNAIWSKATLTVGTGIADPAGGTTACTLTATGATSFAFQTPSAGSNIVRTSSCWIRRRTGTGNVKLFTPDGGRSAALALTASYQRLSALGTLSSARICGIEIGTSGDAVDVWCPQTDDHAFMTSEIPTTTVAVTRGADTYYLPFTTPPQEMTVYEKAFELGSINVPSATRWLIADGTSATPLIAALVSSGFYAIDHNPGSGVLSALSAAPAVGNVLEHASRLYGDGSVDIVQSINSAASTGSTQSAADTLGAAWSGQRCYLNSNGVAGLVRGYAAIQSFKIVGGARSLDEMRAA